MKILVLSDSHNDINSINYVIQEESPLDAIFFVGDYVKDIFTVNTDHIAVYAVAGNCDGHITIVPQEEIIEIGKIRFLLTHGHRYHVKSSYDRLVRHARKEDVQVAIFGHTHIALIENIDGILLINPGSISKHKFIKQQSYALLNLDDSGDLTSVTLKTPGKNDRMG